MIDVVFYADEKTEIPTAETLAWDDFATLFEEATRTSCNPCTGKDCPSKFGVAWSPVVLKPGTTRAGVNVEWLTVLALDLDDLTQAQVEDLARKIEGRKYLCHSTHSHRPDAPEKPKKKGGPLAGGWRLRVILALSRPVSAREWARFLKAAVDGLGVPADKTCKDLSRLYFLPSVAEGGAFLFDRGEGAPIDVDSVLGKSAGSDVPVVADGSRGPKKAAPTALKQEPETGSIPVATIGTSEPASLDALRSELARLRAGYLREKDPKGEILANILDGKEIVGQGEGQANALHQIACTMGAAFPDHTPAEAVVEILRRSIVAMGAGSEGIDYWFRAAARSYTTAHEEKIARDAARRESNRRLGKDLGDMASLRARSKQENARIRENKAFSRESEPRPEGGLEDVDDPEEDEDEWLERLLMKPDTKAGPSDKWTSCEFNAELFLKHYPEWRGNIRFNDVRHEVEITGDAPIPKYARHLDALPRATANWLQQTGISLPESSVASTLLLVARSRMYDPVRKYLDSLVWDGVPRIRKFLATYCGAATVNENGEDISDHLARVGSKWLISAAARGIAPGCKVDTMLILEGRQGAKKSSLFEVLGGEHYAVMSMDVGNKDALMVLARSWIVELSELSAIRKADSDEAKSFFSTRTDIFRLPYGRAVSEVPRRSVCGGSTNPTGDGYLTDRTGNRRYWIVKVGEIDLAAVRRDRDQLFAEAVHHAKIALAALAAGEDPPAESRWWLSEDENVAAEAESKERMASDSMSDAVWAYWCEKPPKKRPVEFTTSDAAGWLKITPDRMSHSMTIRLASALKEAGFEKVRPVREGRRPWIWRSTEAQRAVPERKADSVGAQLAEAVSKKVA